MKDEEMNLIEALHRLLPRVSPVYYIVQAKDGKLYVIHSEEFSGKIHKVGEGWRIVDVVETLEEAERKYAVKPEI